MLRDLRRMPCLLIIWLAASAQTSKPATQSSTTAGISGREAQLISDGYRGLEKELEAMQRRQSELVSLTKQQAEQLKSVSARVLTWERRVDAGGTPTPSAAGRASAEIQQLERSFNLMYVQLQQTMQEQSRHYTSISNIMKTKHDTVKNSISNVR